MKTLIVLVLGLLFLVACLWSGWRVHQTSTREIEDLNRDTIEELERCTGKKRFRETYQNWENVRSLRMRLFLLMHLW